ncbi:hypothetical protein ACFQ5D_24115, partial [Paenibacillus farraposensis]
VVRPSGLTERKKAFQLRPNVGRRVETSLLFPVCQCAQNSAEFLCMFRFFVDSHFFEKRSESKKKILAPMYNKHTGRGVVLSIASVFA